MPLSLNEIRARAAVFANEWADASDETYLTKVNKERFEYLFTMYEKYTSGLLVVENSTKGRKK